MIKRINKWLTKLFGLNLIKSVDLDSLRYEVEDQCNEIEFLRDKVDSLLLGENTKITVMLRLREAEYMVYLIKKFYYIPIAKFPFTSNDADTRKYAKVCAEDLADALREAKQYEPIK